MKKNFIIIFVMIILLLFCLSHSQKDTSSNSCIPPIENLAIPREEVRYLKKDESIIPIGWSRIIELPNTTGPEKNTLCLSLMVHRGNFDQIWFFGNQSISIFHINNNTWEDGPIIPFSGVNPKVALSMNGIIWYSSNDVKDPFLFYYYDEQSNQFIPKIKKENNWNHIQIVDMEANQDGILWFLILDINKNAISLNSFDPNSSEIKKIISDVEYSNLVIADDNSLFLMNSTNELIHYFPDVKKIELFTLPDDNNSSGSLTSIYLDSLNHLWVSDRGWFDFSKPDSTIWYSIIRSPIFIDYLEPQGLFVWSRPQINFESSNHYLWFSSSRGTAWLDPDSGKWCLFTTYPSLIMEDSSNNLWILIEKTLYKYHQ